MAFEGHAVQGAGGGEEEGVAGAEDGEHYEGVNEGGEAGGDVEALHGDDVGAVGGGES